MGTEEREVDRKTSQGEKGGVFVRVEKEIEQNRLDTAKTQI